MRSPNLNALRMFDAAARHLNFRRAAEELHLTQGAVAQQVRRLEADLGLRLFHRQARGLALTEVGRSYHAPVRRALAVIDEATRKLRPKRPESRRIALSVTPSFAAKWLVPRLARFARAHPEIELDTLASEGLADFRSDGIDLAIRQGRPPFEAGLHCELLAPLALCAVCGPGLAEGAPPPQDLADFAGQPLIQDSHAFWDRLFEAAGLAPRRPMLRFNQTALAMDAAANGQGIALAPRLLLEDDLAKCRLVVLWQDRSHDQNGYYLVHPAEQPPNPARDAVLAWVLSEAAGGPG